MTEVNVTVSIQVNIGVSLFINALLLKAYFNCQANISRQIAKQEVESFTQTAPKPFTQEQFEALENRIKTRTREFNNKRLLYLFYGHQIHTASIYRGLRPPAWLTRDVYATGWQAKMRLAQYIGSPRDAIFFVIPDRSPIYGPNQVRGRPDTFIPNLWLPGKGYEYYAPNGTGAGSVLGHIKIPIGVYIDPQ